MLTTLSIIQLAIWIIQVLSCGPCLPPTLM